MENLIPKIPYEKECTIFVEGIEIKGRLNIHTRLFYFTNEKLSSYLEKLSSIDPKTQAKVDLELSYGNYVLKDSDEDFITFTTTFSKSFKSGMFAMPRKFSKEILPILPYEEECIFSVGEVDASGKFNLEFRFLFNSDSIIPKLTSMKEDGEEMFTLTAQDKHGIYDGYRIRRLTPIECERLQGFPDNWTKYGKDNEPISDTQRYKCCGNAVTTNVITAIINEMSKEVIEDEDD